MRFLKHIYYNLEPIIYAALLSIGFAVLIYMLDNLELKYFIVGSVLLYVVLALEIYATWTHGKNKLKQLDVPVILNETRNTQIILHFTLPSLTYWACCAFIFSNLNPHFWAWFLIFTFLLFAALLINIRAYYESKFKLEAQTHQVYDFIKLMIYFLAVFSLISIKYSFNYNDFLFVTALTSINFVFLMLNLIRYHLSNLTNISLILFVSSALAALMGLLVNMFELNVFKVIIYTFLSFYIASGIIHHKIHHNLNSKTVLEYLVFALFAIVFTIGI